MLKLFSNLIFSALFLVSGLFNSVADAHHLVPFQYPGISGKWGYKDSKTDQVKIYWHFDYAADFDDKGYARVGIRGYYGFIDTLGDIVVPIQYEELGQKFNNDTLLVTYYIKNQYYVRSNGVVKKYKRGNWIPEKFTRLEQLEKVLVFHYPADSAYSKSLWMKQMNIAEPTVVVEGHQTAMPNPKENEPVRPFSSFGFCAVLSTPSMINKDDGGFFKTSYLQVNYERYFGTYNSLRPLHFGIGTSFRFRFDYGDTFTYRSTQYTVDLLHRIYLDRKFYIKLGISPVVESTDVTKSRLLNANHDWKTYTSKVNHIQSFFSLGIGFSLSEDLEGQLGYQYMPSSFGNKRIQTNFLGYAFQLKF